MGPLTAKSLQNSRGLECYPVSLVRDLKDVRSIHHAARQIPRRLRVYYTRYTCGADPTSYPFPTDVANPSLILCPLGSICLLSLNWKAELQQTRLGIVLTALSYLALPTA